MVAAGIDPEVTPYSLKSAGLTTAAKRGASADAIRDAARWAPNSDMFHQHYNMDNGANVVASLIVGGGKRRNVRKRRGV
jgi:hypothetical protein